MCSHYFRLGLTSCMELIPSCEAYGSSSGSQFSIFYGSRRFIAVFEIARALCIKSMP